LDRDRVLPEELLGRVELGAPPAGHRDARPLRHEPLRGCESDAARSSRDDRDLAFESSGHGWLRVVEMCIYPNRVNRGVLWISAAAAGDPTLAQRAWVLISEAPDGGWGIDGHAYTNAEVAEAARRELASKGSG